MLFFNEDWIHFLMTRLDCAESLDETALRDFIYQYKGTQITDFCLNVNGSVSTAESSVLETFAERYLQTEANGFTFDFRESFAKTAHCLREKGLDQYRIWIDALREIGIRPWISFRMNDVHGFDSSDLRQSSYVGAHPELWRVRHRPAQSWHDKALDYSIPEVRARMLAYMEEQLTRYTPDGAELDFTRNVELFGFGAELDGIAILNSFMAEVKALVNRISRSCGHEIRVGVLVCDNLTAAFGQGYDVSTWCKEGLVDFVTVAPHWETSNTDTQIGLWRRLVGENVRLGVCQQLLVNAYPGYSNTRMALVEHAFGMSVANLSLGSDYVYLYNHMDTIEPGLETVFRENSVRDSANLSRILHNIAKLETAMAQPRRHMLTYDDYFAPWESVNARLPLSLGWGFKQFRIAVGRVFPDAKVRLELGFEGEIDVEKLRISLNSREISFEGAADGRYIFAVNPSLIKSYAVIDLRYESNDPIRLDFAEIVVE